MTDITIYPVGNARQSYDIVDGLSRFRVTTRSPRRYLVVSLRSKYVLLRTNNRETAEKRARKDKPAVVIDRRIVDAKEAW